MANIMEMGKNPNYLGSWDLYETPNNTLVATIKDIVDEKVVNNGQKEDCTVVHFRENIKPMILNVTNKKTLVKLYKTKETQHLIGKQIAITFEKVKAFGKVTDALRIKNEIPKSIAPTAAINCENCGKVIQGFGSMSAEQTAKYTKSKYGKALCAECATKENQKEVNTVEND